MTLAGTTAIVTGASRGLGREVAAALVEMGASVGLCARESDELRDAAESLGPGALACPCDVQSTDSIRNCVRSVAEAFGGIDVLVNNAAIVVPRRIEDSDDDCLHQQIATNLLGPMRFVREALPELKKSEKPHIVNLSSESAFDPHPFLITYSVTKSGLETFTAGLKQELAAHNVRTTIFRVGRMRTTIQRNWSDKDRETFREAANASGHSAKTGKPMDPKTAARMLVSILSLPADANVDEVEVNGRI